MRAAAVQLHVDPRPRPQPRGRRPPDPRAPPPPARSSSCCPRSGRLLRHARADRRRRRAVRRPALSWARAIARELGHRPRRRLVRRARRRRRPRREHVGPRRPRRRAPRRATARSTCSTSRSAGASTASPSTRRRATRSSSRATADGVELGLTICYDLRFPELYRILAVRGARDRSLVPAAFTLATTRDHWEVLLRARAIEDQAFVVAANQIGEHAPGIRSGGRSMIVDPWGVVLAQAPDTRDLRRRRARPRAPGRDPRDAALARQPPPEAYRWPRRYRPDGARSQAAVDKRRLILDAAVRVFARQGFHTLPRVGHRRRGRRRLRARLPLLPVQGRGARHAVPRALGRHARGDRARSTRRDSRPREKLYAIAVASSSTPTATTRT